MLLRKRCADSAPVLPASVLYIFLFGLLVGSILNCTIAVAQEEVDPPPVDRALSGVANIGDVGRFVGITQLGTLTVSSNDLLAGETARNITISESGFAWTSSGLLLRNGSGSDLVFDGSSEQSQSHDLDVYYFGTGFPSSALGSVGAFSLEDFTPNPSEIDRVANADNAVLSYGGFWNQSTVYRDSVGNEQTRSEGGNGNPFTPEGVIDLSSQGTREFFTQSRTDSSQPSTLPSEIRPIFSAPLFAVEEESVPLQRSDALFQVEPTPSGEVAQLDLSGIEISVSGQSVRNREISERIIGLGRFIKDESILSIEQNDTVQLTTTGSDDVTTRLRLDAFNLGGEGQLSAVLENDAIFNSASSTATVSLSGEFEVDRSQIGTVTETFDVGDNITSLESNLLGEDVQSRLRVGYSYAVVDNNDVVSDNITVFKIGDFDTTGETIDDAFNVSREFSTQTHTRLVIDSEFTLDNSAVQSVTLSEGNGIRGEGLIGEQVIAETTFEVHTLEIASSQLATTEGDVGEGDPITIENTRTATGLDATAFVTSATREGSNRWFFPVDGGGTTSIGAGESLTLTPTFDETGLDAVEEGSLGRNFRTQFTVGFQDGAVLALDDVAQGTDQSASFSFQGFDRFDYLGSEETRQEFTFVVERAIEAEAAAGTLTVAAGTSLRDEGVNLTNTSENTTDGFAQTSVAILDGFVGSPDGIDVSVSFDAIDAATTAEVEALGFDSLSSDIARIEGLDGVLHTLQLNYNLDEDSTLADASLLWFDEGDLESADDDAWVNAILGNSDIESYDLENDLLTLAGAGEAISLSDFLDSRRFELGYTDYLLSLEEGESAALGAFGFDEVNGVVWAVIDHNSSFASTATAIPEPASAIFLMAGSIAICLNRRRSL